MPRLFKHLEAGCLQVNLMSTSAQIRGCAEGGGTHCHPPCVVPRH